MSEDLYSQKFDENNLHKIANYFETLFQNPQPLAADLQIYTQQLNNPRQKIIQMDCIRTRAQIYSQELKQELQKLLTHYVKITNIQYKQGLNQIAAPFIFLRKAGIPINKCQTYFHMFFKGYCMNFYDDKDFNSIELFVKMFSIVLKYHDPALHRYLNWYNIEPQIFCIGWLMTLFANKVSLKMVYTLWQFLIAENDKFLLFFLVLGLVLTNKENIIETKNAHILTIVTNLIFKNQKQLYKAIEMALLLRKNTPNSLVKFFRDRTVFEKRDSFQDIHTLVSHLGSLQYFFVLPSEMSIQSHYKNGLCTESCYLCDLCKPIVLPFIDGGVDEQVITLIETSNDIRSIKYFKQFVLVDLRKDKSSLQTFKGDILSVDIQRDVKEVEEQFLGKYIQDKSKKHFVFMLTEFNFEYLQNSSQGQLNFCRKLMDSLVSFSFPLLGMLEGGFITFEQQNIIQQSKIHPESGTQQFNYNFTEKQLELPTSFKVKLCDKYRLGTGLIQSNYVVYEGLMETLILLDNVILIVENNKELKTLDNYFHHNNSAMTFIYNHPRLLQKLDINRILPLKKLKKASMKIHNQNVLVLYYESCKHVEYSQFDCLKAILDFGVLAALSLEYTCKKCNPTKKKIILEFETHEKVAECVASVTHNYVIMNKKMKLASK